MKYFHVSRRLPRVSPGEPLLFDTGPDFDLATQRWQLPTSSAGISRSGLAGDLYRFVL